MKACSLEQEMASKGAELTTGRAAFEARKPEETLHGMAQAVKPCSQEILAAMAAGKGQAMQAVRQVVERELLSAAQGRLWCPAYDEKARSNQRMMVYTGSHWEPLEPQQWKDFVGQCAQRCGLTEQLLMNHVFMRSLYEGAAFVLAEHRRQRVPEGEVWMNLQNGTLVVSIAGGATLREHSKDDLFTYTLPYCYDPQADCPLWHRFLERVLPEPEVQQVVAEFVGYCLTARHTLEKMMWLYGEGQNGKSVTLEIIEAVLGTENVSYLSLSDLTNDEVKRAGIEGKMLNISHESGKDVNGNVLKQLTSGERVVVKHLYRDPYETLDYGKFIAAFNQLPRAELTFGYFRRLIIVPYSQTISEQEKDDTLADKLRQERPGILNWVLQALPGLMQRRAFTHSDSCQRALDQYRLQSDNVRLFIMEMCQPSDYTTHGSELFLAYKDYCQGSSLKPVGRQRFYDRMRTAGYEPVRYANAIYFKLKLNAE